MDHWPQLRWIPALAFVGAWSGVPRLGHADAAAAHVEHTARHVPGLAAAQPDDQWRDVGRIAGVEPVGRYFGARAANRLSHARGGGTRAGVHSHAVAAELRRQYDGHIGNASFCRAI